MSSLRAVIFDAFETLYVNTPDLWLATFEDICRTQRLWADPGPLLERWCHHEEHFRRRRTRLDVPALSPPFMTYEEAWRIAFQQTYGEMGLDGDPAEAARIAVHHMAQRPPHGDAAQVLPQVREGPWTLAVLSNADNRYLFPVLEEWRLTEFDVVVSSEMARLYKPHPGVFHHILDRIEVAPQEAVYIGDNPYDDVHGAKLVGMGAIWVNRNGHPWSHDDLRSPDHEIRSLTDLPPLLERLSQGGADAQAQ